MIIKKGLYVASIRNIRLRLSKLHEDNLEAKKIRKDLLNDWEDMEDKLYH